MPFIIIFELELLRDVVKIEISRVTNYLATVSGVHFSRNEDLYIFYLLP